jgi:hypothetical protein
MISIHHAATGVQAFISARQDVMAREQALLFVSDGIDCVLSARVLSVFGARGCRFDNVSVIVSPLYENAGCM